MSYGFDMCFKKVSSFAKAMEYANKFVSSLSLDDVKSYIDENECWVPTVRYPDLKDAQRRHNVNMEWAKDMMKFNFVYFKEQKLLGIVGERYPHRKEFFKTSVYFQNSTDQDYERQEWGKIKYFIDTYDKLQTATKEELAEIYARHYHYTKEQVLDEWNLDSRVCDFDINYYRRSMTYDTIYDEMGLDDWLWGHENNDKFTRFSLSWVTTQEREFALGKVLYKYESRKSVEKMKKKKQTINKEPEFNLTQ